MRKSVTLGLTFFGTLLAIYIPATNYLLQQRAPLQADAINVAISPPMQTVLSGGDRYLAANIGTLRALFLSVEKLTASDYAILARVQDDSSLLNPRSNDNYYIAQAILPWAGELESTQRILIRAAEALPNDPNPYFFLGFNHWQFERNYQAAGAAFEKAAATTHDSKQRDAYLHMASKFYTHTDDLDLAIKTIEHLRQTARDPALKQHLLARQYRILRLQILREKAHEYRKLNGKPIGNLEDLVVAGLLDQVPADPLGIGYDVDANGQPIMIIRQGPKRIQ
ncbi:hypothetical protein [Chitinilyticum litopenaei]|uniref:hypothetical protein n=1 Tax=Chitinilyticum litopenaei TaxID=1121276 RepID=UPI0004091C5F|nr:hypothetical protein [Chitinilyticum litopenaei]